MYAPLRHTRKQRVCPTRDPIRKGAYITTRRVVTYAPPAVKEYNETVEYIHLNPVRRGLVGDTRDWKWSSAHEYAGASGEEQEPRCGLRIDRVRRPADENTRI
jgi:hypothetical protein